MKFKRTWAPIALTALLLAACGGNDPDVPGSGEPAGAPTTKGSFTAVVSFGDSLSDLGTYTPATSTTGDGLAPYIGGKFTTNSTTATIWVQNIATALGIIVTPHEVGFGSSAGFNSVKCPAAANPALAATCTGYGQGGSRVTNPIGIGHFAGTAPNYVPAALTVPVVQQVANHHTRFGDFKASDLVFVYAGNNDALIQFTTFGAAATLIKTDEFLGKITADQANQQLFAAQTAAQLEMKKAAIELTDLIKSQILAKGGKYVAVMTLSDIGDTPLGNSAQVGSAKSVLTGLSEVFNLWLRDGLANQPVKIIDTFKIYKQAYADPVSVGVTNNTVPACDAARIAAITGNKVTDGTSLFCNGDAGAPYNGLRTGVGDVSHWQFADSIHPTTYGHFVISEAFKAQLKSFGWL